MLKETAFAELIGGKTGVGTFPGEIGLIGGLPFAGVGICAFGGDGPITTTGLAATGLAFGELVRVTVVGAGPTTAGAGTET
jgi:hypothetical protein